MTGALTSGKAMLNKRKSKDKKEFPTKAVVKQHVFKMEYGNGMTKERSKSNLPILKKKRLSPPVPPDRHDRVKSKGSGD